LAYRREKRSKGLRESTGRAQTVSQEDLGEGLKGDLGINTDRYGKVTQVFEPEMGVCAADPFEGERIV
jgi:hypothetical protein